ncbi:unnamed protein product [Amoebophrya sp. A25]|nr:unnamed protein product [Amoebophrya sp. A25]CAD7957100.1 unnamed protein product [Amoebophrya sp. A25]|eukprot:GSA25T00005946001.1
MPTKPLGEWLSDVATARDYQLHVKLMTQAVSNFFEPAPSLSLEQVNTFTNLHEGLLAGKRVLFRSVRVDSRRQTGKVNLERHRHINGKRYSSVPFDASDCIDLYIVMLYNFAEKSTLAGLFVFPRQFVVGEDVLIVNFRGGRRGYSLYLPGHNVETDIMGRARAKRQAPYYFSLTNGDVPSTTNRLPMQECIDAAFATGDHGAGASGCNDSETSHFHKAGSTKSILFYQRFHFQALVVPHCVCDFVPTCDHIHMMSTT